MKREEEMVQKKSWYLFRDNGLLWFINTILHMFGWAIVYEIDDITGDIIGVYPARVKYRGFDEESNTAGYIKVSEFMAAHADELLKEAQE